ncbi:SWIM zinc finger family protein [Pseudoflavonifractor sp. 524-17]|uniref:SWIM zinc finger family protein n=1 Tax=Pseudoflavonifractor sp. 524-17 TaxID=2304577 RepID=UPI00137AD359|nr:SWIM zinc finger family protein [Pseudoflavonifractor sp. 524-17]NCE64773.1 SWIM zinc finger family protein [Pseudoflavonifractor sp. 524-17]
MEWKEDVIRALAPNASAVENGRKLSRKGSFFNHCQSEQGDCFWADCAGSGKNPYQVSIDLTDPQSPVCRCSCPSRQFPCKHALGLMFELEAGKEFPVGELPQSLADKRAKQAAKAAKKAAGADPAAPAKPKKVNAAARTKKLKKQLEGLDMAERMVNDLLTGGLGTLAGVSAKSYEKLAKDLGSFYLNGPQLSFSRIALAVSAIQKEPDKAEQCYEQALRELIALHSTIQKGRVFLSEKLEQGQFSQEDNVLFEALGGVWKLEELGAAGACKEAASVVQLSFDVSYDPARREYIDRGFWADLDSGEVYQTLNYRPVKALKYVKEEDSNFSVLTVPQLYRYPGELNRRARWESAMPHDLTPGHLAQLREKAQPGVAAAVKAVKNQIKNTLSPKYAGVLIPYARIGAVDGEAVLEDPAGQRIVLMDQPEAGEDHRCVHRLALLPDGGMLEDGVVFGVMFYDAVQRTLCLHPYSLITGTQIVRLQY